MFVKSELFCAVAVKAARIRMKDRMFLFIILFDTKMLFYRDALCGHSERESGFAVKGRDNKVALRDDIHANEHIIVKVAVVLATQYTEIGDAIAVLEAEVYEVGVYLDNAVKRRDCVLFARFKTEGCDNFGRYNRVCGTRVPRGVLNLAVAAVAVSIGHTVGHDHKAVGDDGILPTAKILFKHAHRGSTFTMMLRCGRGVCGTTRVDVNRATCPSAQGSAWTVVVILGKLTLFIAIAINMNSRAMLRVSESNDACIDCRA